MKNNFIYLLIFISLFSNVLSDGLFNSEGVKYIITFSVRRSVQAITTVIKHKTNVSSKDFSHYILLK